MMYDGIGMTTPGIGMGIGLSGGMGGGGRYGGRLGLSDTKAKPTEAKPGKLSDATSAGAKAKGDSKAPPPVTLSFEVSLAITSFHVASALVHVRRLRRRD